VKACAATTIASERHAAAQARRLAADEDFCAGCNIIDRASLSAQEQVSYDLFEFMVASRVTLAQYREWRMPFNSDSGSSASCCSSILWSIPRRRSNTRITSRGSRRAALLRREHRERRTGMRDGFTLPAAVLDGVSKSCRCAIQAPEDSPLWQPFASFPDRVPESDRARLSKAGEATLASAVIPSFGAFQRFFETEYRPAARATIGASALPNGRAYYDDLVRYFTTLPDATPESIHQTGLAEVARIRAEMETIFVKLSSMEASPSSSRSCALIHSSTRRRPTNCCARPPSSARRSTESCRAISASCRVRRTE
jgi:uncharacterized protein (DUF885 family)